MASNAAEVAVDFLAMLNGVGIALDGLPFVNWQARAISCPPSQKQTRMMVAAVGAVEVSCWRKVGPLIAVQTVAAPLNNDPIQNDCSVAGVDRESVLAALQHMNKCQVATDLALLMTEALLCSEGVRLELLPRSMGRGRVVKAGMSSTEASLRYPGLVLLHHDTDVDACDVECLLAHDGPSHVLLHVDVLFEDLRTVRMYVELTPGQIADLPASAKKETFWKTPPCYGDLEETPSDNESTIKRLQRDLAPFLAIDSEAWSVSDLVKAASQALPGKLRKVPVRFVQANASRRQMQ